MSDINDLRQVFNSIKANKTDVAISTEYFIELIASLLDDKMVASTTTVCIVIIISDLSQQS